MPCIHWTPLYVDTYLIRSSYTVEYITLIICLGDSILSVLKGQIRIRTFYAGDGIFCKWTVLCKTFKISAWLKSLLCNILMSWVQPCSLEGTLILRETKYKQIRSIKSCVKEICRHYLIKKKWPAIIDSN